MQLPAIVIEHEPAAEQQAPVGHGDGAQRLATPVNVCPGIASQPWAVRITHEPLGWQHAPVRSGQRLGLQVVSLPR